MVITVAKMNDKKEERATRNGDGKIAHKKNAMLNYLNYRYFFKGEPDLQGRNGMGVRRHCSSVIAATSLCNSRSLSSMGYFKLCQINTLRIRRKLNIVNLQVKNSFSWQFHL